MTSFFSRFALAPSNRGLAAALALGAAATASVPVLAEVPPARAWEIGPIIKGRNYSVGMPLQPEDTRDGISFDIPNIRERYAHVHYVTLDPGSLDHDAPATRHAHSDHPTGWELAVRWIEARERQSCSFSCVDRKYGEDRFGHGMEPRARTRCLCRCTGHFYVARFRDRVISPINASLKARWCRYASGAPRRSNPARH